MKVRELVRELVGVSESWAEVSFDVDGRFVALAGVEVSRAEDGESFVTFRLTEKVADGEADSG